MALCLAAAVTVALEMGEEPVVGGEAPSAIAAGDHGHVWFGGPDERLGERSPAAIDRSALLNLLLSGNDLVVEIAYADASGRQEVATSLYLTKSARTDRAYRVTRVVARHERRLTAGY